MHSARYLAGNVFVERELVLGGTNWQSIAACVHASQDVICHFPIAGRFCHDHFTTKD